MESGIGTKDFFRQIRTSLKLHGVVPVTSAIFERDLLVGISIDNYFAEKHNII